MQPTPIPERSSSLPRHRSRPLPSSVAAPAFFPSSPFSSSSAPLPRGQRGNINPWSLHVFAINYVYTNADIYKRKYNHTHTHVYYPPIAYKARRKTNLTWPPQSGLQLSTTQTNTNINTCTKVCMYVYMRTRHTNRLYRICSIYHKYP